jgi:hypothetical protein
MTPKTAANTSSGPGENGKKRKFADLSQKGSGDKPKIATKIDQFFEKK